MADIVITALRTFRWFPDEPTVLRRSYDFVNGQSYTLPYEASEALGWVSLIRSGSISVDSGGPAQTGNNSGMSALVTASDGDLACSTAVELMPALGSIFLVSVNGIETTLGNHTKTKDCYFSSNGGTTAKSISAILPGDLLYWNGSIAGYELDTPDKITFIYNLGTHNLG